MLSFKNKKKISEINVTPLVDVTLVLLIIFMITAPMLNHGISVNLPVAGGGKLTENEKPTILYINDKKQVFINEVKVETNSLKTRLEFIFKNKSNKEIFIKADKNLQYGYVAKIINETKEAGIKKIGLVTIPSDKK